jgi:hypothetical protein
MSITKREVRKWMQDELSERNDEYRDDDGDLDPTLLEQAAIDEHYDGDEELAPDWLQGIAEDVVDEYDLADDDEEEDE